MRKFNFNKADNEQTSALRKKYHSDIKSPRDGMWETFVDMGDHYLIATNDVTLGYLVLNAENYMLQFYVDDKSLELDAFKSARETLGLNGAFIATMEAGLLFFSLDDHSSVAVNDIMYSCPVTTQLNDVQFPTENEWRLVDNENLDAAIEFAHEAIGANKAWLRGYYGERIAGDELFGLWLGGVLIAAGERRISPYFSGVADLGMIVSNEHRGQGIATNILLKLLHDCRERMLYPICPTGVENTPAQRSIVKSGFIPDHRILKIEF